MRISVERRCLVYAPAVRIAVGPDGVFVGYAGSRVRTAIHGALLRLY